MSHSIIRSQVAGFTLLEVLIALSVLGIGVALTMSLISGTLGNIRKVQRRDRFIQYAETALEIVLLDKKIQEPITVLGDFPDGTRWSVEVANFEMPTDDPLSSQPLESSFKLLSYSVKILGPESQTADFQMQTLKLVSAVAAVTAASQAAQQQGKP